MSFPTDKQLREHGFLDSFEVLFKTPLKWVLLFLYLFALAVYWLVGYVYNDQPENLINRKHRQTNTTATETRRH